MFDSASTSDWLFKATFSMLETQTEEFKSARMSSKADV
jgi:hypothetical protein